jgi:serine protease Do
MIEKLKLGAVIAVSMVLGGMVVVGMNSLGSDSPSNDAAPPAIQATIAPTPEADNGDGEGEEVPGATAWTPVTSGLADLYEEVRPSVVQIRTGSSFTNSGGVGSGIVIDQEGHILTNNHVVGNFDVIDVIFADRRSVQAVVVGRDPGNDLAVIRVDVETDLLVPARLGDSDLVRAGEPVFAVGNPFDLEGTITEGIVSGIGRTVLGTGRPLRQLIQADAAINPGNSGGGLFNINGDVIGITTAIENPSGDRVFVGIGYAVPIHIAHRFLPPMIAGETIQHPRLGVSLQDVSPSMAQSLGLGVEQGVFIASIVPGTSADRAGLRGGIDNTGQAIGDVIIAIDSESILSFEELAAYIDTRSVGDVIGVTIVRDGAEMTIEVVLEAWQSS